MLRKNDVLRVKNDIQCFVGNKVKLQCGRGAHQTTIDNCVLKNVYPNIFTVELYQNKIPYRKLSFAYVDVMTNYVKITSY